MISAVEYTPARQLSAAALSLFSMMNVLVVAAALVAGHFANIPAWESWSVIILIIVLVDVGAYSAFLRGNVLSDTLSFRFNLPVAGHAEGVAAYKRLVAETERHLSRNRLTVAARNTSSRLPGRPGSLSNEFQLSGTDMTLRLYCRGRGPRCIVFSIGPVPDERSPVARRLLSGLREELLRNDY